MQGDHLSKLGIPDNEASISELRSILASCARKRGRAQSLKACPKHMELTWAHLRRKWSVIFQTRVSLKQQRI